MMAYPYPTQAGMVLVPVTGEQQVNTYLVGAGQTVALADFTNGVMWLKSTATNGVPQPLRKFELKEIIEAPQVAEGGVSRQEFDELKGMLAQLLQQNQAPEKGAKAK